MIRRPSCCDRFRRGPRRHIGMVLNKRTLDGRRVFSEIGIQTMHRPLLEQGRSTPTVKVGLDDDAIDGIVKAY